MSVPIQMTNAEAIKILEVAKAEVEWNCPLDYQVAFDMAIRALKEEDRRETDYMLEYLRLEYKGYEFIDTGVKVNGNKREY